MRSLFGPDGELPPKPQLPPPEPPTPARPVGSEVGAPIPAGQTIQNYPKTIGGKRYTTKPTGIDRPVTGEGKLLGLGRAANPAGAAFVIPDLIKSLIESGDWKEAAQVLYQYGPAIYPGLGMGQGSVPETDPAVWAQRYAEDKPIPFGTTRSESLLEDAAAARSMAERSGFEVTEEFGSGAAKGIPRGRRILLEDEDAIKNAMELMGIEVTD